MVAKALDEPRQRVNYHLRALEDHGLVRLVEQRQRRGADGAGDDRVSSLVRALADRAWRPRR